MIVKLQVEVSPELRHAINDVHFCAAGPASYERLKRWFEYTIRQEMTDTQAAYLDSNPTARVP